MRCHPETLKWETDTDCQFCIEVILQIRATLFLRVAKQRGDQANGDLALCKISINDEKVILGQRDFVWSFITYIPTKVALHSYNF